jgi:hypothetical protein
LPASPRKATAGTVPLEGDPTHGCLFRRQPDTGDGCRNMLKRALLPQGERNLPGLSADHRAINDH